MCASEVLLLPGMPCLSPLRVNRAVTPDARIRVGASVVWGAGSLGPRVFMSRSPGSPTPRLLRLLPKQQMMQF